MELFTKLGKRRISLKIRTWKLRGICVMREKNTNFVNGSFVMFDENGGSLVLNAQ